MSLKTFSGMLFLLLFLTACGPGDRLISVSGIAPENKNCVLDVDLRSVGHQQTKVSGAFEEFYSSGEWSGEQFSRIEVSCQGKTIYKNEGLPFSDIYIGNLEY